MHDRAKRQQGWPQPCTDLEERSVAMRGKKKGGQDGRRGIHKGQERAEEAGEAGEAGEVGQEGEEGQEWRGR